MKHYSVLLNESIDYLNIKEDGIYVDATLGYGGHSSEILKRIKNGMLYSFDQDADAIEYSTERLSKIGSNFTIIKSNFENIKEELAKLNVTKIDGIIFDLGVSSPQLDEAARGFSFHQDSRLDMRMDQSKDFSAYEVVNNYDEKKLSEIIFNYGEEKYARSIAKNIVEARKSGPINTTMELANIISNSVPFKYKRETNPCKKTFQAIRIEVNRELDVFSKVLEDVVDLLNDNGRICVITFHSLEDRIAKQILKKYSDIDNTVKGLPNIPKEYLPKLRLVLKKPLEPSDIELSENNRSRSAKLRVAEKIEY